MDFNFTFADDKSLRTQHLAACKHYRELMIKEARHPEDWTDKDNTKIQWVFNYILALTTEMERREREAAEREADIRDAEAAAAAAEKEFDQDDFDAERQMEFGAFEPTSVVAGPTLEDMLKQTANRKMPTLEQLLAMPADHQIHYRCNYCDGPALTGSFYPGRWCTWDCYTKDSIH